MCVFVCECECNKCHWWCLISIVISKPRRSSRYLQGELLFLGMKVSGELALRRLFVGLVGDDFLV